ncbi:TPM domain-containing protein [[Clostridium] polysaccharolyticum]|uniref:Uncharacterized membrane protein YgcG, contains a TPM-fold domain n=1 Tax=[Clostridium] polysaccharolyticum TaxID=29364 RepID=A0A1I0DVF8_9FIRM|nr:TPM domain-containing protein [[Clostridium] polysaccharolyticum]SET35804.1 Uncharacterized membrane protein YgcG, contains a TPM-fold domain [[Clostridium] polysaccharolyticum]
MKRHVAFLFPLVMICLCIISAVSAPDIILAKNSASEVIFDTADLYTLEQEADLQKKLSETGDSLGIEIVAITLNGIGNADLDNYISEFWENQNFSNDCVLLVINIDPADRKILIQGYGKGNLYISSKRAKTITDNMVSDCKSEHYYEATCYYIEQVQYYMNHKGEALIPRAGLCLLGSMVFAGIIVLIMVANSGGKDTTNVNTYLDFSSSKLLAKRDIYTHTTTTRHKRQNSSNSKGGGGGHSHSSGSSSF